MGELTLFERLEGKRYPEKSPGETIVYSIAHNLSNLLSSNKGGAETVPDYGRPDMNNVDMSLFDSLMYIRDQIEESIMLYEKRLEDPIVEIVKDSVLQSEIQFTIRGKILINGQRVDVRYRSEIGTDGKVSVRLI